MYAMYNETKIYTYIKLYIHFENYAQIEKLSSHIIN